MNIENRSLCNSDPVKESVSESIKYNSIKIEGNKNIKGNYLKIVFMYLFGLHIQVLLIFIVCIILVLAWSKYFLTILFLKSE